MKKTTSVFVGIVLCLFIMTGNAQQKSPVWSGLINMDVVSQYIGFGNGAIFYDKPMVQTFASITHNPTGIRGEIWMGTGFNDKFSGNWDDEWDWNICKAGSIGSVCYDIGIGYWDVWDVFSNAHNDIIHPYIELSHCCQITTNLSLTPFVKWEGYYLPFGTDFEEGTITGLGCRHSMKLTDGISFTGSICFNWDDGGFKFEKCWLWKGCFNLEWKLGDRLMLRFPTTQVYVPLSEIRDGRNPQLVVGGGISWFF